MNDQPQEPQRETRTDYPYHGSMIEMALVLVLVACFTIVLLTLLGPTQGNVFSNVFTTF